MHKKTAILFFTRDPIEDAVYKSSHVDSKLVSDNFDKSINKIYSIINKSKLFHIISTNQGNGERFFQKFNCGTITQQGDSFGERFYLSIKETFSRGIEQLIILGNDTPSLDQKDIDFAVKNVGKNRSVLGPSKDGGFYLFAISKTDFLNIDKKKFVGINFQSSVTLYELINLLKLYVIDYKLLTEKEDFDEINSKNLFKFNLLLIGLNSLEFEILISVLNIKYFITLYIRHKYSLNTFTSLSSPPSTF